MLRNSGFTRIFCLCLVQIVMASVALSQPAREQVLEETERLNHWFDERFEERLDFSPTFKTRLGRKDDYDLIDEMTEAADEKCFSGAFGPSTS